MSLVPIPECGVANVDRIHMAVQRDHARAGSDAAKQVAHGIDGDFVVIESQHFVADTLNDLRLPRNSAMGCE
jgi:hypothetical protein